ncbi:MAG: flagellar hook-basal body complex protein FliE [Proteobacteria bacterium]|nr:flagellar hook-basal body complex protein FliE [Pseudomonadota bacterium]
MNTINNINSLLPQITKPADTGAVGQASTGFGDMLKTMIDKVNDTQAAGDQATRNLQSGDAKHLHEVMIAVEESDVSLRMLVQMRNKALTAYEEIMRMQI